MSILCKTRRVGIAAVAACSLTLFGGQSDASLLPCKQFTNDSLFPNRYTVDLWILDLPSGGLSTPMSVTGLSTADVKLALERAAEIWNEESGSSLHFRVRGTTHSPLISDALVVTGQATTCTTALALAFVDSSGATADHRFVSGTIEVRQHESLNCSANIDWCVAPNSSCKDLVAVLIHELGHAGYNLAHANNGANCTHVTSGFASVMFSDYIGLRARTLKQWDLELAQSRYTPRSNTSLFYRDHLTGTSSWIGVGAPGGQTGKRPLVRMGSMPANVSRRYLSWVRGGTSANDGGTGFDDVAYYETAGISDWLGYGGWSSQKGLTRPVALAGYRSGLSNPLLLTYEKYITPQPAQYDPTTDQGVICYRQSSNGLTGLGSEMCTAAITRNFGLTASYDSNTNTYLIGYVANDSLQIGVVVVPAFNNFSTPTHINVLSASSHHAPSIACNGSAGGCKVLYEAATNSGSLSWLNITVAAVTGVVTVDSSFSSGLITMDTPSIAYWASDSSFRVAYAIDNYAAYTYKIVGNTITGTGDAFNDFNSFISSPVVNPRVNNTGLNILYTWFVKPW